MSLGLRVCIRDSFWKSLRTKPRSVDSNPFRNYKAVKLKVLHVLLAG